MWKKEYIFALRERDKKSVPLNSTGDIIPKEGDVVCIMDDSFNTQWKLGRILRLVKGSDGEFRVAELKTSNGITTRPLSKLCYLESCRIDPKATLLVDQDSTNPNVELNIRPKRQTALGARSKIVDWAQQGLV